MMSLQNLFPLGKPQGFAFAIVQISRLPSGCPLLSCFLPVRRQHLTRAIPIKGTMARTQGQQGVRMSRALNLAVLCCCLAAVPSTW